MLRFIGVGPGDPDLMTVKARRLIQAADLIALADSGTGGSAVEGILGNLIADKEILWLPMPMKGVRADWAHAHAEAARMLEERLAQGRDIAYPALGDPLLYATSGYLIRLLGDREDIEVVPGVPAICAAAAKARLPLAEADEPLLILPGLKPGQALPDGNVAVMKAAGALDTIAEQARDRQCVLVRNLGMKDEYVGNIDGADPQKRSYFSTVLIKGTEKR